MTHAARGGAVFYRSVAAVEGTPGEAYRCHLGGLQSCITVLKEHERQGLINLRLYRRTVEGQRFRAISGMWAED